MNKAIFLDRDGTINKVFPDKLYVDDVSKVQLLPGVKQGLEILKKMWYKLIIITNQTGVGAWYYTQQQAESINNKIEEFLWFKFDKIYSCYHHPDDNCNCRKPKTKNVEQAIKDFDIDVKESYFIWDKEKDIKTWKNILCKWTILISDKKEVDFASQPDYIVTSILQFANILENYKNNVK